MRAERWAEIKNIVNECLEMDAGKREAFIAQACEGDGTLMTEVESLLASHADAGNFMETAAIEAPEEREESLTGRQFGPYQVGELIARGGMGAVYRAVRASDFQKQVAIKVVKRGMDTDFILQRFRHERQ